MSASSLSEACKACSAFVELACALFNLVANLPHWKRQKQPSFQAVRDCAPHWQPRKLVLPTSSTDSEADRARCLAVPRLWSDCRRSVRLLASPGTSRPRRVLRPPPVNENEMTRWSLLVHPEATIASLLQPQLAAHIAS